MVRLISRQRGSLAALKLTKLFGIDDFPAAKDSGKVLIIIIYCYLIIIIITTGWQGPQLSEFFQKPSPSPDHDIDSDIDSSLGTSSVAQRVLCVSVLGFHAAFLLAVFFRVTHDGLSAKSSLRSSRFLFFSRRRSNRRAKEHAWGEQKLGEKWGGVSEKGEGVGRKKRNLLLVSPLPLLLIFRTLSQF